MVDSVKESVKHNIVFKSKDLESLKNFRFKTSTITACSTKKRVGNIFLSVVTMGLAPLFSEHVRFAVRGKNIKHAYEALDLNTASDAARLHTFALKNLKNKNVVKADVQLLSRDILKAYEQREAGLTIEESSLSEKFASLDELSGSFKLDEVPLHEQVISFKVKLADKKYCKPSAPVYEKNSEEEKHYVKKCYYPELKLYLLSVSSDQEHAKALLQLAKKEGSVSGGSAYFSSYAASQKFEWDRWLERHFPEA